MWRERRGEGEEGESKGRGREGEEGERKQKRMGRGEEREEEREGEKERRHNIYTSPTHKSTLSYIMSITPLPSNKPYNICILVYTDSWPIIIIVM